MNSHQPHPDWDAPSLEEITAPEGRSDSIDVPGDNGGPGPSFDAG